MQPGDDLSPWVEDPASAEDPTPTPDPAPAPKDDPAPAEDPAPEGEPPAPETGPEPAPLAPARPSRTRPTPRSELSEWTAQALPSQTSSLDDWLQGPIEQHAEREAEDAWSTAGAVSGTWRPRGEASRSRTPDRESVPPDGTTAGTATAETSATGSAAAGTTAAEPEAAGTSTPQPSRPAFRRELHGLRALALGLVAIYHIWLGRVSGGVDVFLFLSAFFLTGTFVRRLENGRPLGIPRYWLHTFKRLLPPAAVTILLTLGASAAFLPSSFWPTVMQQSVASMVQLQNALLVFEQVDYHARDAGDASPLQHFWSLSMQGQAFIVWPLLFALVVGRARAGKSIRRPLIAVITLIGGASLAWSIISTQTQQQVAYFDTAARLWEFAAGSLLALSLPLLDRISGARRPEDEQPPRLRTLRALTGWAGIAALLACGIALDVSTMFPGWIAIWPLAAAGAVVVAGHSGRRWGVDRLLSTRPAAFAGDISYALYLVHWPILVVWLHHSGQERAGLLDGLVVLTASVLLAWVLTRAVDAPVRRSRWLEARSWRAVAAVAASVALVAGAAGGWWTSLQRSTEGTAAPPATAAVPTDEVATVAPLEVLPHGWQLGDQWPDLPEPCSGPWAPAGSWNNVRCQQLLPADAAAEETIVVVGSSHSRQFIPALLPLAESRGAQVVNLSMDGCEFLAGAERSGYCRGYDDWVLEYLDTHEVDTVLTTVTRTAPGEQVETMLEGTDTGVQAILDRGIDVIATRDTPRWEQDQFQCAESVIEAGGTPLEADDACGADIEQVYAPSNPAAALAELSGPGSSVTLLDPSTAICPSGRCSPVLGDVYVYLDDNHLTELFVQRTLAPVFSDRLGGAGAGSGPSDGGQ